VRSLIATAMATAGLRLQCAKVGLCPKPARKVKTAMRFNREALERGEVELRKTMVSRRIS
jgi:hypothetical protein